MSDKIDVAVYIEPLHAAGEPPVTYCLPSDTLNLATIILRAYDIHEILRLHEVLTDALASAMAAYSGPSSPREIN